MSERHVARLDARPVDRWPGLSGGHRFRATRFVRPSLEASRPELYDLDSRVKATNSVRGFESDRYSRAAGYALSTTRQRDR
jgi:hypothetical protein